MENGGKTRVIQEYSPTHPKTKLGKNIYELEEHVGEKPLSLNLGLRKKLLLQVFSIIY